VTGVNTQRVEAFWGWLRLKLVRRMRGICRHNLRGYLAEEWWRSVHDNPFLDMIEEIRRHFPIT